MDNGLTLVRDEEAKFGLLIICHQQFGKHGPPE